jgi:hypothetical protein
MTSSLTRFLDQTKRRTTVGRTPLDEWSARRRDLYLTTHNTHNRQTSMPPAVFETTISAGERPQTYALDRAVTGTGSNYPLLFNISEREAWKKPEPRLLMPMLCKFLDTVLWNVSCNTLTRTILLTVTTPDCGQVLSIGNYGNPGIILTHSVHSRT